MDSRFIVFFGAVALSGCSDSESDDGNRNISCIRDTSGNVKLCVQTRDYADEGCDGDGEEKDGFCWIYGFEHECEGTRVSYWAREPDQCPPPDDY